MFTSVIIPAAGSGKRMGGSINKQFLSLHGKPILICTLEQFQLCDAVDEIIISTQKIFFSQIELLVKDFHINKVKHVVEGGRRRQDSVANGLSSLAPEGEIVIVHDAVRPFIHRSIIIRSIAEAARHAAAVVAVRVKDTVKVAEKDDRIARTMARELLWTAQTPQTFQKKILINAYENAAMNHVEATDDSSLVEALGIRPVLIEGSYDNIKITTPEDLDLADVISQRFKD
jgi:2-C-methyl-D-erythritol 4-phosphate cytidylyltransferase